MMWDYDAFPLWEDGTGNVEAHDLPISTPLGQELQAWADERSNISHPPDEWPDAEWLARWNERGRALLGRLRHELAPDYEVGYYNEVTQKLEW